MKLAMDVHYRRDGTAAAAGVLFPEWESDEVAPYEPGSFYRRELPCLMQVLEDVAEDLEAIVIDGYVVLGKSKKPGLGMHLYESLKKKTPIIGVAKTEFEGTPEACRVYRGRSGKPLFVTSAGMALAEARSCVENMHGENRIPTLLKRVDQWCRGIPPSLLRVHGRTGAPSGGRKPRPASVV